MTTQFSGCLQLIIMAATNHDLRLSIGTEFKTLDEFLTVLDARKQIYGERWVKGNGGRTVQVANRQIKDTKKHFRQSLGYQHVNYRCIHSGKHVSTATERNRGSNKLGCPVQLLLSVNRQKDALVVVKLNLDHNHDLSPQSFHYAMDRRPTAEEAAEIKELAGLGVPASKIISHLSQSTGKIFRRHDIYNILRRPSPQIRVEAESEEQSTPQLPSSTETSETPAQHPFSSQLSLQPAANGPQSVSQSVLTSGDLQANILRKRRTCDTYKGEKAGENLLYLDHLLVGIELKRKKLMEADIDLKLKELEMKLKMEQIETERLRQKKLRIELGEQLIEDSECK